MSPAAKPGRTKEWIAGDHLSDGWHVKHRKTQSSLVGAVHPSSVGPRHAEKLFALVESGYVRAVFSTNKQGQDAIPPSYERTVSVSYIIPHTLTVGAHLRVSQGSTVGARYGGRE